MEITKTIPIDDTMQRVLVTITHGDDSYGFDANTPILEGEELQAHCDANEFKWLNNILYQVYGRNIQFPTLEKWDEWIAAGCKLEEIKETRVTQAAVEAADAVMGERQVVVESEVEEEVSTEKVVLVDGKYVEQTTTETVTKQVSTPQFTEHQLYNEDRTAQTRVVTPAVEAKDAVLDGDGAEIEPAVEAVAEVTEPVLHSVPTMESFEVTPAVEAVAEVTEEVITRPETVVEKVAWKDTAE